MSVYIVTTDYFMSGVFGVYSTIKRARLAFEQFIAEDENIVAFEDTGDYGYLFTTSKGEQFGADIRWSEIDEEFNQGLIKEDE